jgi:hypothetical protein
MPTTISSTPDRSTATATATSSADSRLEIDVSRARQTERPATPFRDVLTGGVSLLMSGAEVASHVVAGPVMAAAVHDARIGAVSAIGGNAAASAGTGVIGGTGVTGLAGSTGSATAALGTAAAAGAAGTQNDVGSVQSLVQDGQASNMQLLALQEQIQNESQQFSTVSNVVRAKYDTAKAAVSNIRA